MILALQKPAVVMALALVLLAVINAVNVLVEHHERASTAMQLPL